MPARRTARRRRLGFPRASTTPGKVRLIRTGLGAACLAWGALAALMHVTLLPAARDVYAYENARPAAASAQATGLVAGVAVLTLAMAAGCTRGLSRRLAEDR